MNDVLEEAGTAFSSEFQVGYDDFPFYPWTGRRALTVLQVPVHPICEGLFFDAGAEGPESVIAHLVAVVRAKLDAGEPAFVYGHPERRLGRHPEIVAAIADEVANESLAWRVGLSTFARWWRWRASRAWSLLPKGEHGYELQFEEWDASHPIGLEIIRDRHSAVIPIVGPRTGFDPSTLAYERKAPGYALPRPIAHPRDRGLKSTVRGFLDWETATPIEDLPRSSIRSRLKRGLRTWRDQAVGGGIA